MSPNEKLVAVEGAYLIVSAGVLIFWLFEIYRTAIARQLAPLLQETLVQKECSSCCGTGREGLAQLLSQWDSLLRDGQATTVHELDEFVIVLAVAHLLRSDPATEATLQEKLNHLDSERFDRTRKRKKRIISAATLAIYLAPYKVSKFKLKCLAARLRQDWEEMVRFRLAQIAQPA